MGIGEEPRRRPPVAGAQLRVTVGVAPVLAFRVLGDDARAAWLGFVVGRTFEASLNMAGDRHIALQDRLGCQIGIDMAQWWRPTAANYFDRVSKQVILDALTDVGGPELSARFASVKKTDLAMSAERVFAGAGFGGAQICDDEARHPESRHATQTGRGAVSRGQS